MIKNVAPGIFRGPKPGDLFPFSEFRTIISLETGVRDILFNSEHVNDIPLLVASLEIAKPRQSIFYCDLALSGWFTPLKSDVVQIAWLIDRAPKPLYVHCRAGRERTGFVIAAWRMIHQGWSFRAAYTEFLAEGARLPQSWLWKKALMDFEVKALV